MNSPTKEQLKELMQYLGQTLSVPQIVQHFKSDNIYSTEERMIGRWVNGRPLYQKILIYRKGETNSNITRDSNGNIFFNNFGSEKYIVDIGGTEKQKVNNVTYTTSVTGVNGNIGYQDVDDSFCYYNNNNFDILELNIKVKYIKTTDTSSDYNIGSPYDYSLDETIIGSWIDGSPLYQKVISYNIPTGNYTTTAKNIDTGISFADKTLIYSTGINNGLYNGPGLVWPNSNKLFNGNIIYKDTESGNLYIRSNDNWSAGSTDDDNHKLYFLLQYTKQ